MPSVIYLIYTEYLSVLFLLTVKNPRWRRELRITPERESRHQGVGRELAGSSSAPPEYLALALLLFQAASRCTHPQWWTPVQGGRVGVQGSLLTAGRLVTPTKAHMRMCSEMSSKLRPTLIKMDPS